VAPDRSCCSPSSVLLVGHGDPVRYPGITTQLDYEGELAVVIGQTARNVSVDQALDYVGATPSSTTSPP